MEMYSIRVLQHHPLRLALTVGGIALCVVLILFLLSVYRGVEEGSVEYVRHNRADLWVLQEGASNILRASSILSTGHGTILRNIQTVKSASPILFLLSSIRKDDKMMTVYLTGFDPVTGNGGPPSIHEGRNIQNDDEIVLDRSFARKMNFRVGQSVHIKDDSLRVVGLSRGTNMFVIQYAFVTLRRAQLQIGYPGLVTCYMVNAQDPRGIEKARESRKNCQGLVFTATQSSCKTTFMRWNPGFFLCCTS